MVSEVVEITLNASNDIIIKASFIMENLSDNEEQMDVYFPLSFMGGDINDLNSCQPFPEYAEIKDFSARIDGKAVETHKKYEKVINNTQSDMPSEVEIPCWAYFAVTFPPEKDVSIQVSYNSPVLSYILATGAGWNDTIGSADIYIRFPYELNELNFHYCMPNDCSVRINEIYWHYENFEPDFSIGANILFPATWYKIQDELDKIKINPNDGEAWGRLGKIYKEIIRQPRGYNAEEHGVRMFQLSVEAYTKAVTLKPNDADWHYGYADLMCWEAWFVPESQRPCIEQIKQTLDINPNHQKAWELLRDINGWYPGAVTSPLVDISGSQPIFLILTQQASTITVTPSLTMIPETVVPTSTPSPKPSLTITVMATQQPPARTVSPVVVSTSVTTPAKPRNPGVCNSVTFLGMAMLFVILKRKIGKTRNEQLVDCQSWFDK